jgi:hypothetical protein
VRLGVDLDASDAAAALQLTELEFGAEQSFCLAPMTSGLSTTPSISMLVWTMYFDDTRLIFPMGIPPY